MHTSLVTLASLATLAASTYAPNYVECPSGAGIRLAGTPQGSELSDRKDAQHLI